MTWEDIYGLIILKKWFHKNILTKNEDKTKCMPIALQPECEPPEELEVKLHSCGDTASTVCVAVIPLNESHTISTWGWSRF